MTQQEKQLLLKDLCARLPYKTKVFFSIVDEPVELSLTILRCLDRIPLEQNDIVIKPYLRPMSSMTEEEYNSIDFEGCRHVIYYDKSGFRFVKIDSFTIQVLDYLNARHFDFRNLIEKGLALEAKEGMYKTE